MQLAARDQLESLLASLRPREREAVRLVYVDRRSHDETAEILRITDQELGATLMAAFRTIADALSRTRTNVVPFAV